MIPKIMLDHEAANLDKDWVLVRQSKYFPSLVAGREGMQFYVVLTGPMSGSDKTLDSLFNLGYRVEIVP